MFNIKKTISLSLVCFMILINVKATFASGNGLMVTKNSIINFQFDEYSDRRIQVFDLNGNLVKQTPQLMFDSIVGRKDNYVLFTSRVAMGCYYTYLMNLDTADITFLAPDSCDYYYIDNDKIYLMTLTKNYKKFRIFDLKGNKLEETNNILASSFKNKKLYSRYEEKIDDPVVAGTKQQFKVNKDSNNNITLSSNIIDNSSSKIFDNTDNVMDWTADANYIYYIKGTTNNSSILFKKDRATGLTIQKNLNIRSCEGLQIYNNKLLFSGYGYSNNSTKYDQFNHAIFTVDLNLDNVLTFSK